MTLLTAPPRSEPHRPAPHVRLASSIDDVDSKAWDQVVADGSLFLQRRYLRCLEHGDDPASPAHRYALLSDPEGTIGVARFQSTEFVGKPAEGWLAERTAASAFIAQRLGLSASSVAVRLIVCGSPFTTGEHGFAFAPGVEPARGLEALAAAVRAVETDLGRRGYSAVLVKEFSPVSKHAADGLRQHSFAELPTAPNMVLPVDPEWGSFEGYLESLSSKFRVKARRADAKSAALRVRHLSADDLRQHRRRMSELYGAVLDRAEYRLGRLDVRVLERLASELGDDFVLKGYFLRDRLVGFMSGFVDGGVLEAHVVGVDYGENREHAIYCRMLYDYLRVALERGLHQISYGRTADEIKSSVGALPVPMSCYVRHRDGRLNRLLPALARVIRVPQAPLREPFKKAWYAFNGVVHARRLGLPSGASA